MSAGCLCYDVASACELRYPDIGMSTLPGVSAESSVTLDDFCIMDLLAYYLRPMIHLCGL